VKRWIIFVFLLVVTDPYQGRGIDYAEDESQLYEYYTDKSINLIEPEPEENETRFSDEETNRFIKKIDSIINAPAYFFEH